jgi:uncharacterized protein (TIGR03437 family)
MGNLPAEDVTLLFNGVQAPVLYDGRNQVNAIVPFSLDPGSPAKIRAMAGDQVVGEMVVGATNLSPALFTQNGGSGAGAILNQDYNLNTAANPATRGSIIILYGTGFGGMDPTPADGQPTTDLSITRLPVTASIAGSPAEVIYAGSAPGLIAGLVQINVKVPADATPGPTAPVSLQIGGVSTPPGVTVSIQ